LVNQSKPTVAIFGGSFDPPHKGHQQIVEKAIEILDIDKLLVVPAYLNPFKISSLALASTRLAWCHTLFSKQDKVQVEDYEIKQGKSITTSETVKHFNMTYHVKYLIIGSDNLSTLSQWHEFEWLNKHITWVIITRDGYDLELDDLQNWKVLNLDVAISSTHIRDNKDVYHVDDKIKASVKDTLEGNNK